MKNRIVVLEGLDASGKGTQTKLLCDKLIREGIEYKSYDFPRYESESSVPVRMYLSGKLGKHPEDTNAYAASSFFAVDRYISYRTEWKTYCDDGMLILLDRYTSANALHQLSKMPKDKWKDFLDWLYDFEFDKLGLPHPELTLFLDMHPDVAIKLMNMRTQTTGRSQDIHELDHGHLYKSYEAAQFACEYLGWKKIVCFENGSPKPMDEIAGQIYGEVQKIL